MLHRRTVGDVMTREVITVRPETPLGEIAALLDANDIAAAPVVDEWRMPLGIVTASDVLRHESGLPEPLGADDEDEDDEDEEEDLAWARARARTAGTLMTSPVFAARAEWSVPQAARELHRRHVKQLPVVDQRGLLAGIVSRSDLLGVFCLPDDEIRKEIEEEVLGRILRLAGEEVTVEVNEGAVTLEGRLAERRLAPVVAALCQGVDGVVEVHSRLDSP